MKKEPIDFKKTNGMVPVIIQDYKNGLIYMLGYMNKLAFKETKESGYVHFWSRSRNKLWMKGENSGNKLKVREIFIDCDNDTLLIKTELEGKCVCHTGKISCFFKNL